MTNVDELIREAQYVFGKIGPGSASEKKNIARATNLAKQVLRRYPGSIEADQARAILDRLEVQYEMAGRQPARQANAFTHAHSDSTASDRNSVEANDWASLLRLFMQLPQSRKQALLVGLIFVFLVPGSLFVLFGVAAIYATRPSILKEHLRKVLMTIHSR